MPTRQEPVHAPQATAALLDTPERWASFVTAFTHELRTPLGSLQALADLLGGLATEGETDRRYVKSMLAVVQDLRGLIGEASLLARLSSGGAVVHRDDVALADLVRDVADEVRSSAWDRGIALSESLDPALPRTMASDRERLRQLLGLMVEVAVARAVSEAHLRLDREDGAVRITVSCDGGEFPGVAPEQAFEPFGQAVRIPRRDGGRSLALPLALKLAEALGGSLRASNRGRRPTLDLRLALAS